MRKVSSIRRIMNHVFLKNNLRNSQPMKSPIKNNQYDQLN